MFYDFDTPLLAKLRFSIVKRIFYCTLTEMKLISWKIYARACFIVKSLYELNSTILSKICKIKQKCLL